MGIELLLAKDCKAPEGYTFTLSGDLNQMSEQRRHLRDLGFQVEQSGVYPIIQEKDKRMALTALYNNRIPGWWHYCKEYFELGICAKEEFKMAYLNEVERK